MLLLALQRLSGSTCISGRPMMTSVVSCANMIYMSVHTLHCMDLKLLPCVQELPDSEVPAQPEKLFCSQCCNDSMTMVRLATTEQLQDWLTVLHSKPSCKQPVAMQVCCRSPSRYTIFVPSLLFMCQNA